jgi:hypothetical protein
MNQLNTKSPVIENDIITSLNNISDFISNSNDREYDLLGKKMNFATKLTISNAKLEEMTNLFNENYKQYLKNIKNIK